MPNLFSVKFRPPNSNPSKTIPLTIDGVSSGNIVITRDSSTGFLSAKIVDQPESILSYVYIFEKTVASVNLNSFVTLLDVTPDSNQFKLPTGVSVAQFLQNGAPQDINDSNYLYDLQRWKQNEQNGIFTTIYGNTVVSLNDYNAITKARRITWNSNTFTCYTEPVIDPPVDVPVW